VRQEENTKGMWTTMSINLEEGDPIKYQLESLTTIIMKISIHKKDKDNSRNQFGGDEITLKYY
jgi:hypothetical protein